MGYYRKRFENWDGKADKLEYGVVVRYWISEGATEGYSISPAPTGLAVDQNSERFQVALLSLQCVWWTVIRNIRSFCNVET